MMVIVINGGEYSDYWEHWYESRDEGMTHADLGQRLLEHRDEAEAIMAKRDAEYKAENVVLFGPRGAEPWTWHTLEAKEMLPVLRAFNKKWEDLPDFEAVLLGLCGLTRIAIDLEVDVGYSFPCNREDVEKLADEFIGGK